MDVTLFMIPHTLETRTSGGHSASTHTVQVAESRDEPNRNDALKTKSNTYLNTYNNMQDATENVLIDIKINGDVL